LDTLLQDLRFAVRTLLKSPGFTTIAVLCLALGIGANTTIFSVVNAVLLRPFPYADPDRIVALHQTQVKNDIDRAGLSWPDYLDVREQSTAYSQLAAYTQRSLVFSGREEPERLLGGAISADLFPLLGVKPVLGRTFRAEEDQPGGPSVVLISHELWRRRFDGDPNILNKTVLVNAVSHTIIGVMPPRFKFPEQQLAWVPLTPWMRDAVRSDRDLSVLARLKPGATVEQARAEITTIAKRLAEQYPDANRGWGANVLPLREEFTPDTMRLIILTMMGAVVFVLLIACANVANLLLARATARQREVAVRVAFGAGRGRVVRQLLTESVVISLLGAALGIVFAVWGIRLIEASFPAEDMPPYWIEFTIDGSVLLFTVGIAVLTGLLFGLAPALQALKVDLHETLKEGGRGAGGSLRRNRLRAGLVVAEVALSLVLLVGASLFVRSFLELQSAKAGFDTADILTLRIYLPNDLYPEDADKTRRIEDVLRRIEELPGVEAAAASNNIPLSGGGGGGQILLEGRAIAPGEEPGIFYAGVTPHFFKALGVPLLAGRGFTDREGVERSGLAVVNQTFAEKFWPEEEAIGRRFRFKDDPEWLTIIGVVPTFKNDDIDDDDQPSAYLPHPYMATPNTGITIRTRYDPLQTAAAARREVRASDANLPVFEVYTMEQVRERGYWEHRLFGGMFSTFGGIALFLAAIGVYGVLSYAVSQRLREIGIRIALGARNGDVVRLVLRQGLSLALAGIGLGLLGAFGVTRVISSILYNVSATDPLSFGGISLLLAGVAALASYLPARRALEADPLEALRNE
jgi:putative ABC transport system permease protein